MSVVNRTIKKVTILGSGVMGSRIACHFANIGVEVLLLDITPNKLTEEESAKGFNLEHPKVKNRIVNEALQTAIKSSPAPLYVASNALRIKTGNFTDDLSKIGTCDWVMEVVVENLTIKQQLFAQIENYRKPGTLITSNTSGIPIHLMLAERSADFIAHFCGTHFFNPPRYLRLLEIIPTPQTDPSVTQFLLNYGDIYLGKTTVQCKDTPAFIANRIGVYGIMSTFYWMEKLGLSIDEIDALTGPICGRPKSATFRTCDVVGLDTLIKVANGLIENCKDDEQIDLFKVPDFVNEMANRKWIGDKTGQGFYKKDNSSGKKEILTLNTSTFEYQVKQKSKWATLETAKPIDNLKARLKLLVNGKDKAAEFYRNSFYGLFAYVSHRIPEIADHPYQIDDAMKAGFGWELGPFEIWDVLGIKETVTAMEQANWKPAAWIYSLLEQENPSFYSIESNTRTCYEPEAKTQSIIPNSNGLILLDNFRSTKTVWKNSGVNLIDIGDDVLNLEFNTKMNSMGGEVLSGILKAIEIAEKNYRGLVIGNEGLNFSAGANVAMMFMLAMEQEFDELDMAVRLFQQATMRIRYSSIPVVVAPHDLTLGGACESCLHADKVVAAAETYIGMVEVGVGIIPAGGGSKEFAVRASDEYFEGDVQLPTLQHRFLTIAQAKVATSAQKAFELGIFRKGNDEIIVNKSRQLTAAKNAVIELANKGYVMPIKRKDIKVLGRTALGAMLTGANAMKLGNYISDHDLLIVQKLAYVMCGGDLSSGTTVSEQYLLDLEREAFLSLVSTKKTLERLQSVLTKGKPVRN
jgi:3-hydroxyacyl-CoA dehydrogenase